MITRELELTFNLAVREAERRRHDRVAHRRGRLHPDRLVGHGDGGPGHRRAREAAW